MTNEDYRKIVQELLSDVWGDRHYPTGQTGRLWQMVRDISAGDFRQALDNLNLSATRPPTLGQIRGVCMPAMARGREERKRSSVKQLAACTLCGTSGWVEAYRDDAPLIIFAFICSCSAATELGIQPGKGARFWSTVEDQTLVPRFCTAEGVKRHRSAVERWQGQRGLIPLITRRPPPPDSAQALVEEML